MNILETVHTIEREVYESYGLSLDIKGLEVALEHDMSAHGNNNRELTSEEITELVDAMNCEEDNDWELIKLYPNLWAELKETF